MRLRLWLLLTATFLVVGCGSTRGENAAETEQAVSERAKLAMYALQAADGKALATLTHPGKGVRFSPYAFVRTDLNGDLVFRPTQLLEMNSDNTVYRWGTQDATGKPLEGTLSDYLKRFAGDYVTNAQFAYNQVIKQGNTKVNIREAYPEGVFVELHLPGTGEQADFTWSSVRLVFERDKGAWYLVGVVSDQWTI